MGVEGVEAWCAWAGAGDGQDGRGVREGGVGDGGGGDIGYVVVDGWDRVEVGIVWGGEGVAEEWEQGRQR